MNACDSPPISKPLSGASRSFGDISEALPATPTHLFGAFSPGHLSSSSFLRIYIGSSTAVVEKRPLPLRDALASKLKSRGLDVERCVAYVKDSNVRVEWETEVATIAAENIVVAELSDEIQHSFVS